MSLRIAPAASHPTSTTNTQVSKLTGAPNSSKSTTAGAPSAPGLPDTLRTSHNKISTSSVSSTPELASTHPLESRLANWTATQNTLHNTLLRRNFGIALPLRMQMEQQMVRKADGFRPSALGPPSRVHDDILSGRDAECTWEDVYGGQDGLRGFVDAGGDGQGVGWHDEMERKVGMGKW